MLILGLTGNIGCGKTSISSIFKKNNIDIIDADIISREIFEDQCLLEKVFEHFGPSVKNDDQTLNRKALGKIVFNDNNKLLELNSLTHPKIKEKILCKIDEIKKKKKKVAVIDAALLVEGGYLEIVDKLLVVTCKQEVQIKRIQNRDNCTIDEAIRKIRSQMPQDEKSRYADYIIDNSGTIDELTKIVLKFIDYMKENWCG